MAKEISALQVAEFLQAQGLAIPAELQERIDNAVSDAAWHKLNESVLKGKKEKDVTAWQERLFSLAENMHSEFRQETKNVGRGQMEEQSVSVDTPNGTLFVRLRREVESGE